LCGRVAIMDKGKIMAIGPPQKLKDEIGGDVIEVKSPDSGKIESCVRLPWIKRVETHDGFATLHLRNAEKRISEVVNLLNRNKVTIESISVHKPTLEDVFLHYTGKTIREEEADSKDHMRMRHRMWKR